jgi:hypothetical protein
MSDWLTVEAVAAVGGMAPPVAGTVDAGAYEQAVAGTMAYVERQRADLDWTTDPTGDVLLGAAMLAQRYFQRRNSPLGTVGSPDLGMTSILRTDPDISDLLGIGKGRRFTFAAARPAPEVVIP